MNTFKKGKAGLLALFQTIAELLSIIIFFVFLIIFFCDIGQIIYELWGDHKTVEFVKKSVTSFELLFIAPIPILIVFAFKTIMVKIFPEIFNDTEYDSKNLLKLDLAKKTFISSIIGILSTFILSTFLAEGTFDNQTIYKVLLFLVFMIILIVYYKILSAHSED